MKPTQVIQKISEQNARKERQQDTTVNIHAGYILNTYTHTSILEILHVPYIVTTNLLHYTCKENAS